MTTTNMRTAGIWIDDGFILLSRGKGMQWGVPGGGLEPNETVEAGCLREYQEEIGLTMQTHGMALILEHFWSRGAVQKRAYEFYFWVQPADGLVLSLADVRSREENLEVGWFRLDELTVVDLVPVPLKEVIPRLGSHTLFLSTRD